jgi:hypothetical protein
MLNALVDERIPLVYQSKFREFGLSVAGGPAIQVITHCPWDGSPLPDSLRDEFFDQLEARGLELDSEDLPPEFLDDAWWRRDET